MKKSLVARGITGIVASLLGVAAVGCGAEVGDGAAGDSAEIGSTAQAIGLTLTTNGDNAYDAKFPAYIPISSTEMLVLGGYDSSGTGSTDKIRKATYDFTNATVTYAKFTKTVNGNPVEITLNHPRGDAQVVKVATNVYAVFGGKTKETTSTQLDTVEIIDLGSSPIKVTDVTAKLGSGRVNFGLTPCGTDHFLVSGGFNSSGAVTTLEVFTYVSSNDGADSTIATMKNADNGTTPVSMTNSRAFHAALALPSIVGGTAARILLAAGEDPTNGILGDSEVMDVNTSCQFVDSDAGHTLTAPIAGASLPSSAVRTQFASAARSIDFVVGMSTVTHEAIIAAGKNASNATPVTYLYDDNATPGSAVWRTGPTLASAHVRGSFAERSNGDFVIAGGRVSATGDTTREADLFTDSADTFSNVADFLAASPRIGAWVGYIGSTPSYIAGHGAKIVSGVTTLLQTAE